MSETLFIDLNKSGTLAQATPEYANLGVGIPRGMLGDDPALFCGIGVVNPKPGDRGTQTATDTILQNLELVHQLNRLGPHGYKLAILTKAVTIDTLVAMRMAEQSWKGASWLIQPEGHTLSARELELRERARRIANGTDVPAGAALGQLLRWYGTVPELSLRTLVGCAADWIIEPVSAAPNLASVSFDEAIRRAEADEGSPAALHWHVEDQIRRDAKRARG